MKYPVEVEGPNGWTIWIQPLPGYRMMCCDCGLVHNFQFRVRKGKAQFRAQRNMRASAAARRNKKRG